MTRERQVRALVGSTGATERHLSQGFSATAGSTTFDSCYPVPPRSLLVATRLEGDGGSTNARMRKVKEVEDKVKWTDEDVGFE